jgi:hypothetical protein
MMKIMDGFPLGRNVVLSPHAPASSPAKAGDPVRSESRDDP